MFEQRFVESMKMDHRNALDEDELGQSGKRPIQFKPSLMDRVLPPLGEAMISIGLKLKNHSHQKLDTEQAQSPNYMIML